MARQGLCPIRIYQPYPTYYVGAHAALTSEGLASPDPIQPTKTISIQIRYRYPRPNDREFACYLIQSNHLNGLKLNELSELRLTELASLSHLGIISGDSTDVITTSQGNATWIIGTTPLTKLHTVHYTMIIIDKTSHTYVSDTLKVTSVATPNGRFGCKGKGGQATAYEEIKIGKITFNKATPPSLRTISFDLQMSLGADQFDIEFDAYKKYTGEALHIFSDNIIKGVEGLKPSRQKLAILAEYHGGEEVTITATATAAQVTSDGVNIFIPRLA